MTKNEYAHRAILELIASDPNGKWNVNQICENIYGHFDRKNKGDAVRRAVRNMKLPGTWRLGRPNNVLLPLRSMQRYKFGRSAKAHRALATEGLVPERQGMRELLSVLCALVQCRPRPLSRVHKRKRETAR
jgi:hypothetical protein